MPTDPRKVTVLEDQTGAQASEVAFELNAFGSTHKIAAPYEVYAELVRQQHGGRLPGVTVNAAATGCPGCSK